jgi:hypothetical protein
MNPYHRETLRLLRVCFEQATYLSENENIYPDPDNNSGAVSVEYVREHLNQQERQEGVKS